MKISAQIRWTLDSVEIEPRLVTLLESVARNGNLQAAAKSAGLSYRHAWGLLEAAGTELGDQLVHRQQGRGTQLAPLGTKLLEGMVDINGSLAAGLREGEARMAEHLARAPTSATNPAQVTLFASHDLALAQMRDIVAKRPELRLSLQFHGSLDCLAAMRRNQCELAGFHLPSIPGTRTLAAQMIPFLSLKGWRATRLLDRTQGLMVKPGNPKKLTRLADLTQPACASSTASPAQAPGCAWIFCSGSKASSRRKSTATPMRNSPMRRLRPQWPPAWLMWDSASKQQPGNKGSILCRWSMNTTTLPHALRCCHARGCAPCSSSLTAANSADWSTAWPATDQSPNSIGSTPWTSSNSVPRP